VTGRIFNVLVKCWDIFCVNGESDEETHGTSRFTPSLKEEEDLGGKAKVGNAYLHKDELKQRVSGSD